MAKKTALTKDIFREIWKTKNRFLSIFTIIALGTGFFTGIKVTCPDMKLTAANYYQDTNLMDAKLLSTYGVTQEDIDVFAAREDINEVMPAYSVDAIANPNREDELIVKVMSYQDNTINRPVLLEGRLPQTSGECVVEQKVFTPDNFVIGQTIEIASGTDEPISDTLKTNQYTIVGVVQSSLYVNFEHGSTSLGNGSIDSFIMVPADDFQLEVYTELYLKLNGAENLDPFTDDYDDFVSNQLEELETVTDQRGQARYDEILQEAQTKLQDGRQELEEAKQTQQQQLADAKAKLDDAKAQLESGQIELDQQKQNYQQTITSAQQQLDNGSAQLAQAEQELNAKQQQYETSIVQGQQQLNDGYAQLTAAMQQLDIQRQQLDALPPEQAEAAKQQLDMQQQQLDMQRLQLDEQAAVLASEKESGKQQLDAARQQLQQQKETLQQQRNQLETQKQTAPQQFEEAQKNIDDGWEEYQSSLQTFEQEKADSDQKIADAEKELQQSEADLNDLALPKWYLFDRSHNPGYSSYGIDAERVDNVAKIFPLFFILVAMLVCLTTMTRMVEEHRTQIGTFKALGYSKRLIVSKYVIYSALASLLGSIFGILICSKLFPMVIFDAYRIMYVMPDLIAPFPLGYTLLSTIVALLCTSVASFISCYAVLISQPAQLMRPKAPPAGKKILLECLPSLWSKFSFLYKVTLRNIFRYKKRISVTIIGIAGCTALMVTGFGLQNAISSIVPKQFDEIFIYDSIIAIEDHLKQEEIDIVSQTLTQHKSIESHLYTLQKSIDASSGDGIYNVTLFVPQDSQVLTNYVVLRERIGQKALSLDNSGVIINEKLAKLLDLSVGDNIELANDNGGTLPVKISAITENYTMNFIYMSPILYQECFGDEPVFNTIVLNLNTTDQQQLDQLSVDLIGNEYILGVSFTDDNGQSFEDMVSSLNYIVLIIIISAGVLAFVVLYNLTNVNIAERSRELATIKVLGFFDREVSAYIYRENIFCTIFGILFGLVGGIFLENFVVSTAEVDVVMFTPGINFASFLFSGILTLLFTFIVNFVMFFKLKKLDMVESLKSIE